MPQVGGAWLRGAGAHARACGGQFWLPMVGTQSAVQVPPGPLWLSMGAIVLGYVLATEAVKWRFYAVPARRRRGRVQARRRRRS